MLVVSENGGENKNVSISRIVNRVCELLLILFDVVSCKNCCHHYHIMQDELSVYTWCWLQAWYSNIM